MGRLWMVYIGLVSIAEGVAMILCAGAKPFGWRVTASLEHARWQARKARP